MKTITILIGVFFILGFSQHTGSQPERDTTIRPPSTQVITTKPSAVYRLKAINDSASFAIENKDLSETKKSWITFQSLSRSLTAYTYKIKQMAYRERTKSVRDTVLQIIYVDEADIKIKEPEPEIEEPKQEIKKESWLKKLFKNIF